MALPNSKVAVGWLVSVLLISILTNVLAAWLLDAPLVWLPTLGLALVVALLFPGGLLRRERAGGTRLGRLITYFLLAAYPVISWLILDSSRGLAAQIVPIICIWGAASGLAWQSLHSRIPLAWTGMASAALLVGLAGLLLGLQWYRTGDTMSGTGSITYSVWAFAVGIMILTGHFRLSVGVMGVGVGLIAVIYATVFLSEHDQIASMSTLGVAFGSSIVAVGILIHRRWLIGVAICMVALSLGAMIFAFLARRAVLGAIGCGCFVILGLAVGLSQIVDRLLSLVAIGNIVGGSGALLLAAQFIEDGIVLLACGFGLVGLVLAVYGILELGRPGRLPLSKLLIRLGARENELDSAASPKRE